MSDNTDSQDLTSPTIIMEESISLSVDATLQDAIKADLPVMNAVVAFTYASWEKVTSINSLCKMVQATNTAIEGRRNVLGLPYGHKQENNNSTAGKIASRFFSGIK